jgi:hypothetical protein
VFLIEQTSPTRHLSNVVLTKDLTATGLFEIAKFRPPP